MQCAYFTTIPIIILTWICILLVVKITLKPPNDENNLQIKINLQDDEEAEQQIYTAKKRNKPKIKYHVPKFMLELYEDSKKHKNYTKPDIVRSLIPKHAGALNDNEIVQELADNHLIIFDLPSLNAEEKFVSAELKILTLVQVNSSVISGVERQLKISIYDDLSKSFYSFDEIHVSHSHNTWISFNVTQPVVKILQKDNQERFLKIVISISEFLPYYRKQYAENSLKLSLMPVKEDFEHDYPILLLSYASTNSNNHASESNNKRQKRSLEEDYEEETNNIWDEDIANSRNKAIKKYNKKIKNTCRRKPLYIDFAEIEYNNWIVQPTGYQAYQCQGKCFYPVAEHLNPTKHAIVQALLHSVDPAKASRSCCVPTILDSISILYIDNKGVLTYRYAYKDMVVLECGCR